MNVDAGEDRSIPFAGLLGLAGTALAVGIASTVRRLRRQRIARAPAGFAPPPLTEHLATLQEIASTADDSTTDDVRNAMSAMAKFVAGSRSHRRLRPLLVQVSATRIEVLLDGASPSAPPGWDAEASGKVWACARPVPHVQTPTDTTPTLVTIGAEQDATVLLDLEAAGVVTIGGTGDGVTALLRSVQLELQHRAHPSTVAQLIVGNGIDANGDGIRHADAWEDVEARALAWAKQSHEVLSAHQIPTTFAARGAKEPLDAIAPMVVICTEHVPAGDSFDELCTLSAQGAATGILARSDQPVTGSLHIHVDSGELSIPALGFVGCAQGVEAEAARDVAQLVVAAEQAVEPVASLVDAPEPPEPQASDYCEPPTAVVVRVLGDIEIDGHDELKAKPTALLGFIALHPGCTTETLLSRVWTPPSESRPNLYNYVTQIRTAIGADHLPPSENGRYRVGPHVRTDLELLERRIEHARGQGPAAAMETLRGGLELVRGPVFEYRRGDRASFTWVDLEDWVNRSEPVVIKAALSLSEMATEQGDTELGKWAARRGLLASPANSQLTDALIRCCIADDDLNAAEEVFLSHARALEQLELGDPEPSTIELWEALKGGGNWRRSA